MINHEHKFIFIHIPKCAGMSIGRTLINLTNENEIVGLDTLTPKPEDYSGFKIHHNRLINGYVINPLLILNYEGKNAFGVRVEEYEEVT